MGVAIPGGIPTSCESSALADGIGVMRELALAYGGDVLVAVACFAVAMLVASAGVLLLVAARRLRPADGDGRRVARAERL